MNPQNHGLNHRYFYTVNCSNDSYCGTASASLGDNVRLLQKTAIFYDAFYMW